MSAAYHLANDIEWAYARARARLKDRREPTKERISQEFDPHLATELMMLIEARMTKAQSE